MAQLLRPQEGRHLYVALQLCQRPRLHGPADMASHLQPRFALQHASGPVPMQAHTASVQHLLTIADAWT